MKRIINIIKAKLGMDYDPYEVASVEQRALWELQGLLFNAMQDAAEKEDKDTWLELDYIYKRMQKYF